MDRNITGGAADIQPLTVTGNIDVVVGMLEIFHPQHLLVLHIMLGQGVERAVDDIFIGRVSHQVEYNELERGKLHPLTDPGSQIDPVHPPPPGGGFKVHAGVGEMRRHVGQNILIGLFTQIEHGEGVRRQPTGAILALQRIHHPDLARLRIDRLQVSTTEENLAVGGRRNGGNASIHRKAADRLGIEAVCRIKHRQHRRQHPKLIF